MQVAVRELKARLSKILARAQAGEVIEVTSHKRTIARIVGIPAGLDSDFRLVAARGDLAWTGGKPRFKPPLALAPRVFPLATWCWRTGVDPVL